MESQLHTPTLSEYGGYEGRHPSHHPTSSFKHVRASKEKAVKIREIQVKYDNIHTYVSVGKTLTDSNAMIVDLFQSHYFSLMGFIGRRTDDNIVTPMPVHFVLYKNPANLKSTAVKPCFEHFIKKRYRERNYQRMHKHKPFLISELIVKWQKNII